jgi:cytochrome c556
MRWLVVLLVGLAVGALGAVTVIGAMRHATPLPKGLMAVTGHQFATLRRQVKAKQCPPGSAQARLRTLRALGDDVETAFLPTGRDDERFRRHLADYLGTLDAALASPPAHCAALEPVLREVGARCEQCHDDYR